MMQFDVAIVGGGPVGLATAIALRAEAVSVVVIERGDFDGPRIGEHLAASALVTLEQLGVASIVADEAHRPTDRIESAWGSDELVVQDAFMRPWGRGWTLDRRVFDRALGEEVERRGGQVFLRARIGEVERRSDGWQVLVDGVGDAVRARRLVDATGRSAAVARRLGHAPIRFDTLTALVSQVPCPDDRRDALVESVSTGWWYSSRLAEGALAVMFFTDADRLAEGAADRVWREAFEASVFTRARVPQAAEARPRGKRAASQWLAGDGDGWLAVGDAALAVDPLSASGLSRALRDAVEAVPAVLAHSEQADRRRRKKAELDEYLRLRTQHYRMESRFSADPFWARRHRPALDHEAITLDPHASLRWVGDEPRPLPGAPDLDLRPLSSRAMEAVEAQELVAMLVQQGAGYSDHALVVALQRLVERGQLAL
jgi:flavin-dependent dehydrogenase